MRWKLSCPFLCSYQIVMKCTITIQDLYFSLTQIFIMLFAFFRIE